MTKPKVLAYVCLHYGKDYLAHALESVYSAVDEILILYTHLPSHGSGTSLRCPDTKEELLNVAAEIDVDSKIRWHDGTYQREGIHRDNAFAYARKNNFDVVVALDSDEVWNTQYLKELIQEVYERKAGKCLIWMRHLWRSFDFICDDPMRQERIYYLGQIETPLIYADKPRNQVWHFGYAREIKQIEYKISIHGHSKEWLMSKEKWLHEKYMPFPPESDVHPTCKLTWFPKSFDKSELPEIMKSHPYYNLKIIE